MKHFFNTSQTLASAFKYAHLFFNLYQDWTMNNSYWLPCGKQSLVAYCSRSFAMRHSTCQQCWENGCVLLIPSFCFLWLHFVHSYLFIWGRMRIYLYFWALKQVNSIKNAVNSLRRFCQFLSDIIRTKNMDLRYQLTRKSLLKFGL